METNSAKAVMNYFGYEKTSDFARDWKELSAEDKTWFKDEVEKVMMEDS